MDKHDFVHQRCFGYSSLTPVSAVIPICGDSHKTKNIFERVCSDPVEGDFRESSDNLMQKNDGIHIPNQITFLCEEFGEWHRACSHLNFTEPIAKSRKRNCQEIETH
jgi:hypothetical protein